MASFNRVLLIGNVTRDPEIRFTAKGTPVAERGLAVNRITLTEGERREEVLFVDVTLWARLAEIAQQYLGKGSSVFIEGRLQQEVWQDKTSGQKRSRLRVIGENLQMLGRPESGERSAGARPAARPQPQKPKLGPPVGRFANGSHGAGGHF
jgi:single-strand DNA-binding protein